MNRTVLITGATSGIGYEFSKVFATNGFDLILTGRNTEILNNLKEELSTEYSNKVYIYRCDFTNISEVKDLYRFIKEEDLIVDVLVNNAGAGYNGYFHDISWEKHEEIINVNIMSLTCLTRLIISDMKEKGVGKILNVASTGAYQPGPLIGVYYATKAYVLSFSQALREEVSDFGVSVTTLCPGATKTNFSKRSGKGDLDVAMTAKEVAEIGFRALMKNKDICVPGTMNKFLVVASKFMPSSINAKAVKKIQGNAIGNK